MAGDPNGTVSIETASHIPIAQLTPLLTAPATRSVKAIVSLTWPYSSATGTIAFLLAEPDFRLRKLRGQVRVQFGGSSAKCIAKAGIASGDEVTLGLDGVEWVQEQEGISTPGRGVEFELKFTERLHLQFRQDDSSEISTIDIDHPAPEPEVINVTPRVPTPEPSSVPATNSVSAQRGTTPKADVEWSSPAFLKRARTSYGSLFDSDYDPFSEEDGTVRGKGRKRTRLSSTWRYSSRSPTPEEEEQVTEPVVTEPPSRPTPIMTDEACQTVGLDLGIAAEALADFSRQATNIGSTSYPQENGTQLSETGHKAIQDTVDPIMRPPMIQTQQPELGSGQLPDFNHEAPSSPKLHPIPSDSLPFVSPMAPHSYGVNHGQPRQTTPDAPLRNAPAAPNGTATTDEEDIYEASPAGRRGKEPQHESHRLRGSSSDTHDVAYPAFKGQYAVEDQYGHWQNANAQLSHPVSPVKAENPYHQVPAGGEFYTNHFSCDCDGYEEDLRDHHGHASPLEEYPELDPGLRGRVQYPDLPEQNEDLDARDASYPLPPPRPIAMSRSQSAQSPVVDLTEDSDEEDKADGHAEGGDSTGRFEPEEEFDEDEAVGDYSDREATRQVQGRRDQYEQRGYDSESEGSDADAEGSEGPEDESAYYFKNGTEGQEEELRQDPRYLQAVRSNNGEDYDNEDSDENEGSYDEEEEGSFGEDETDDDELQARPSVEADFIVIDLLSSDDEDARASADAIPTAPQTLHSRIPQQPTESTHESDGSDSEEDVDGENAVPYTERAEIRTHIQHNYSLADQDEDAMYEEEDVEDSVDNGAVKPHHIYTAPDIEASQDKAASLTEGSEDEIEDGRESEGSAREVEPMDEDHSRDVDAADEPQTPQNRESIGQDNSHEQDMGEEFAEKRSEVPERPSLSNLDGANDEESIPRASYPALFSEEPSPPASVHEQELESQEAVDISFKHTTAQLPTPDATQPNENLIAVEASFTSVTLEQTVDQKVSVLDDDDHKITKAETSTEVEMQELTGTLSSINPGLPNMVSEPAEAHVVENDEPIEADDVLMTGETIETKETVESTLVTENSDAIMADETLKEAEATEPDDSAPNPNNQSLRSEQAVESTESTKSIEIAESGRETMIEETAETEHNLGLIEKVSAEEPDEITEAINSTEQSEPSVDTESMTVPFTEADTTAKDLAVHESGLEEPEAAQQRNSRTEVAVEEPEFTVEHPRRSHRRVKSTTSTTQTEENTRPVTPVRSDTLTEPEHDAHERHSPMVVDDAQTTPKGHDASIELALSSLESPSKQQHDLRKPPVADLKLRLSRALRTELSEFTALKVLRYHMNQKLDVLAVATTTPPEPQRAKGGPRQYQISFNITDPSIAPSGVTEVQVFRPYKDALPTVSAGDGILLRNFQVTSVKESFALRSTQDEGSSWAVFKEAEEPDIRGPPVEYGQMEKNHMIALKGWYGTLDDVAKAKIHRANGDKAAARR